MIKTFVFFKAKKKKLLAAQKQHQTKHYLVAIMHLKRFKKYICEALNNP